MRRIVFIFIGCLFLFGCNGVSMTAKYQTLLEQSAAMAQYDADNVNTMTVDQMRDAIRYNDCLWQEFLAASKGKEVSGPRWEQNCKPLIGGK